MGEPMTNTKYESFRKEMKSLREDAGMSRREFAEYIGMSQSYIYNIEAGLMKPSMETAEKIADALEINIKGITPKNAHKEWKEYGRSLIRRRTEKGLKISQVAQLLGIPREVYMRYEEGVCLIQEREKKLLDSVLGEEKKEAPKEKKETSKEKEVEFSHEIPYEIVDVIIKHVKDLNVSVDIQKKVYRYFAQIQMDMAEKRIFG